MRIGALARHADVLASADVRRVQPLVSMALAHVAHATIRNRGTTVGSIVHADAAAEMPVVLSLLGGSVDVVSSDGTRTIDAADLFVGPLETSLRHDEIAVSAFFPALEDGTGVAFDEIARRHGDYALCGVAATVRLAGGDVVEARAGYLSVNEVPTVVDLTAALQRGLDDSTLAEAGELALGSLEPGGRHPRDGRLPRAPGAGADCQGAALGPRRCPGEGAMSEQPARRTPGRERRGPRHLGAGTPAAVRRAAPRPGAHRHARRLRARRVRRVHGARGRPTRCGPA